MKCIVFITWARARSLVSQTAVLCALVVQQGRKMCLVMAAAEVANDMHCTEEDEWCGNEADV